MKCLAARKEKKPRMSKEDRKVLNQLESRYLKLRMRMGHKEAMEQLRREVEAENAASEGTIRTDDPVVCETGSDTVEERKD